LRLLFWVGTLMFLFALSARRRLRYELNGTTGRANVNAVAQTDVETLPHPDTLHYALTKLPVGELARLRTDMAGDLVRRRVLERFRLLGRFYLVAIDGTGYLTFTKRHCPRCLTRKLSGGRIQYYHPLLEAKLVCENGLVISLGTEFIENTDGAEKQECELKAFGRLLPRLRRDFPQLSLCLLLDGLYMNQTALGLLRKHHCAWIITFKEGSLPQAYGEWRALWPLTRGQEKETRDEALHRRYRWLNDLDHAGHRFDVFECRETCAPAKPTRFVWATNLHVAGANVVELSQKGGRCRWKIENEGFNTQKNRGYGLEHAYSQNWNAARNFYFLMQIAHLLSQLLVKGTLRHTPVVRLFGSLRAFALRLLEAWRTTVLDERRRIELLATRCQIRLDDS
jgi:hypothetical protein